MTKSRSALRALTRKTLEDENHRYTGRGGISAENRGLGFLPAYLDGATGPASRRLGWAFFFFESSEPSMWPLVPWPQLPLGAFLRSAAKVH